MFLAKGPIIQTGESKLDPEPSILDFTPTVLCALGLPADTTMDGKPLVDIFRTEYKQAIPDPVAYTFDRTEYSGAEAPQIEADEQQALEDHLRALGYLD
jgi:arylsulfatase A-like enzyme